MRQLRDDTHLILDGEVLGYKTGQSLQASRSISNGHQAQQHTLAHAPARVTQAANSIKICGG